MKGYKAKFHATKGNEKCHYANFGFPAVTTCRCACKYGCDCVKKGECYALLQERQYPEKMKADWENLLLYKKSPELFKKSMTEWMVENREETMRGNESGDAPDENFWWKLKEASVELPGSYYYAYTKEYKETDFIEDVPVWKWPNVNLMLSEWGDYVAPEELKKYYRVYKAIPIYQIDEMEAQGYVPCPGNCGDEPGQCNICKYGTANVYCVIHGSRAIFPIPEEYRRNEKADPREPGFIKFGGKTIGGVRDAYCRTKGIKGYENRIQALKTVWRMMKAGALTVWKNGLLLTV